MTFVWHIAEGYTPERFRDKQLTYALHSTPVEIWGEAEQVAGELHIHNEVTAGNRHAPGLIFLDAQAEMPHDAETFNDVCHFTPAGQGRWMDLFIPAIVAGLPPS